LALAQTKRTEETQLRIGFCYDLEESFFVELLCYLLEHHSQDFFPKLLFVSGHPRELDQKFKEGALDIVFTSLALPEELSKQSIQLELPVNLFVSGKVIASSQVSKLKTELEQNPSQGPAMMLKKLENAAVSFVLPSPELSLRKETDRFFKSCGFVPTISIESDLIGSTVSAIANGLGAGLIPLPFVLSEKILNGPLHVLGPPAGFWQHSIWLHSRPGDLIEQITERFKKAISYGKSEL
jgi:DNA-binding transcriptional LysR family regulator